MRTIVRSVLAWFVAMLASVATPAIAGPADCTGHFVNPISDVDWSAMFPVSVGALPILPNWHGLPDAKNPASPLCFCGTPIPRVGIEVGFWEPVRLVDVTYKPWCFVNLGGIELDPGFDIGLGNQANGDMLKAKTHNIAQWQEHFYIYPLLYWLNIVTDFVCLETLDIDIAFITEVDPLWTDDVSSAIFGPENAAFTSMLAQTACMGDCTIATAKLPSDELFWCAGCWGPMLPMTGNTPHQENLQSGKLAVARLLYMMHRVGLAWGTMGDEGVCHKYYMPVMRKTQYRIQMTNPVAMTGSRFSTTPIGTSTLMPKNGIVYPVKGEDQGYLIWRKRNCCVL
jgi:conjugal transfer pilus assembly protein TraU